MQCITLIQTHLFLKHDLLAHAITPLSTRFYHRPFALFGRLFTPGRTGGGQGCQTRGVRSNSCRGRQGFAVGALMSANAVYVFFDPQCPHCGHLWQASLPLHKKVKFVWIPVAWINASSLSQGAALLTSANPLALMSEHETSLLAGRGGIAASSSVSSEVEQTIKTNTKLLGSFGAESVPFVVFKNATTGQTISRDGAMTTAALAQFAGVDVSP